MYKCGKLSEQEKFLPNDFKFTGMRSWDEADETVRQVCLFLCLFLCLFVRLCEFKNLNMDYFLFMVEFLIFRMFNTLPK